MNINKTNMSFQEIVKKLEECKINPSELEDTIGGYGEFDKDAFDSIFGNVEEVHSIGGTEGGGDYAERVYLFKDHNVYIKITGFYSSYHGTDWDEDFKEVSPRQKTITVYE